MGFFKNILTDAENCGYAGMDANATYVFLKDKYAHVDFSGDDFNFNGPVYDAYQNGRAEYQEDIEPNRSMFSDLVF